MENFDYRSILVDSGTIVQWVGGANYSYLHFNFMVAAIASVTNENTMVGGSIGNVINISISIVIKHLFNSLSDCIQVSKASVSDLMTMSGKDQIQVR